MGYLEVQLRTAAANWAIALLNKRPEETQDECAALDRAMNPSDLHRTRLWFALAALLEHDDTDCAETSRQIFEALGEPS